MWIRHTINHCRTNRSRLIHDHLTCLFISIVACIQRDLSNVQYLGAMYCNRHTLLSGLTDSCYRRNLSSFVGNAPLGTQFKYVQLVDLRKNGTS